MGTSYPLCQTPARVAATDFCFGENADETEYKNIVHFARALQRLSSTSYYNNWKVFWTNMYTEKKKVYLSSGQEAYPKWAKDEPGAMDDTRPVGILFTDQGVDDGYIYKNIYNSKHVPVCQKPARTK